MPQFCKQKGTIWIGPFEPFGLKELPQPQLGCQQKEIMTCQRKIFIPLTTDTSVHVLPQSLQALLVNLPSDLAKFLYKNEGSLFICLTSYIIFAISPQKLSGFSEIIWILFLHSLSADNSKLLTDCFSDLILTAAMLSNFVFFNNPLLLQNAKGNLN